MVTIDVPIKNIKGIECKHVCYQEAVSNSKDDLLLIKEVVHTKDNQQIHRLRTIENYKRPVYITKKPYRNHTDRKEYEEIEKLQRFDCTTSRMATMIQKAKGRTNPNTKLRLRDVCDQFVYGADLSTPTMVKAAYKEKYPDAVSPSRVAVLDIETDVVYGTDSTIMVAVTMGDKKIIAIADWWANKVSQLKDKIPAAMEKYLSEVTIGGKPKKLLDERGREITIITDRPIGQGFKVVMNHVHDWMPDFLAIWNIDFDLPKLLKELDKENIPYEDVFSDPCVPPKYRNVWYKQAKAQRETNSKVISQHPADLWHVLFCNAGFYVICAMASFKKIRVANGNEPSYSLEAILNKYVGIGKLKIPGIKATEGTLAWHIEMQRDHPVEYCVYNIFDCIGVELLDEITGDLSGAIPTLAGISEFAIFPSQPRRLVDKLHYFHKSHNLITASCGKVEDDPLDEDVIPLQDWIATLPAYSVMKNGLKCIKEVPNMITSFHNQTGDDDIAQAYPTGELICNVSKETTAIELKDIEGVSLATRRRAGINLTSGKTNSIEICNELLKMPYIDDVLKAFEDDIEKGLVL